MTLWLWAACLLAPAFATTRAVVPVSPLAQLAPVLGIALPALSLASPSSLIQQPASLALVKAQVLAARASAVAVPSAIAAPIAEVAPSRAIEAVNSVLRDVTPERLAEMSDEELNSVGGLILDAMNGAPPRADAVAVKTLARASAERLTPMLAKPQVERTIFKPGDERHEEQIAVSGLPEGARWTTSQEGSVYRHYTTEADAAAIEASQSLLNGFASYIQRSSGLWRKIFEDATGLFLTRPGVSGADVGVPASDFPRYIDLKLPAGMPVLELEGGRILLVPLPARTRGWIADLYRRWATGEPISSTYQDTVNRLDTLGGPGPNLAVPITILGTGPSR